MQGHGRSARLAVCRRRQGGRGAGGVPAIPGARAPSLLGTFRSHPVIDAWLEQFQPEMVERSLRFKPLLLRGESRSGKSMKASSIFGFGKTLAVNCQGVAPALPSIRAFDRMQHKCILWDELHPN